MFNDEPSLSSAQVSSKPSVSECELPPLCLLPSTEVSLLNSPSSVLRLTQTTELQ